MGGHLGGAVLGTGPTLLLTLGPGVYTFDFTVIDLASASDTDAVTVSVALPSVIGPTGSAGADGATGATGPIGATALPEPPAPPG